MVLLGIATSETHLDPAGKSAPSGRAEGGSYGEQQPSEQDTIQEDGIHTTGDTKLVHDCLRRFIRRLAIVRGDHEASNTLVKMMDEPFNMKEGYRMAIGILEKMGRLHKTKEALRNLDDGAAAAKIPKKLIWKIATIGDSSVITHGKTAEGHFDVANLVEEAINIPWTVRSTRAKNLPR